LRRWCASNSARTCSPGRCSFSDRSERTD
jgi:hypothetical protein